MRARRLLTKLDDGGGGKLKIPLIVCDVIIHLDGRVCDCVCACVCGCATVSTGARMHVVNVAEINAAGSPQKPVLSGGVAHAGRRAMGGSMSGLFWPCCFRGGCQFNKISKKKSTTKTINTIFVV